MRFKIYKHILTVLTVLSITLILVFVAFLFKEALPFFKKISFKDFLLNDKWIPIEPWESFGIFNIVSASLYIGVLSCIISLPFAYSLSLFICFYLKDPYKTIITYIINFLSAIPSVIYGFFGMMVVVKFIENFFKLATGESVLAGAIVLSVMILPFFLSTILKKIEDIKSDYFRDAENLNVSKEYFILKIVIKLSFPSIITGFILAFSRAIGETMAVMMVIGNSPIAPKILGKAETISSLIALEIGMSEVGSIHYGALFASGFILLILNIFINIIIEFIRGVYENK